MEAEWTSFLQALFYWAGTGGHLNRIQTVKCSHNRLVKGSRPGNPGKDAFTNKKWLSTSPSINISPYFPPCQLYVWVGGAPPGSCRLFHCGGVSPTISMPCCWSWARSSAFSFFSSSILEEKNRWKNLIINIFIPVTAKQSLKFTEQTFSFEGWGRWLCVMYTRGHAIPGIRE